MKTLKIKELNFIKNLDLSLKKISDLPPLEGFIGQKEAEKNMEFGLKIPSRTHHIFVSGTPGTGRTSVVMEYVRKIAEKMPPPPDIIYVYSHENPFSPKAIILEKGTGKKFKRDFESAINESLEELREIIKRKDFNEQKERILNEYIKLREKKINEVIKKAKEIGIFVREKEGGFDILPIIDGRILAPEEISELPEDRRKEIKFSAEEIRKLLDETIIEIEKLSAEFKEKIRSLLFQFGAKTLATIFPPLIGKYAENKEIVKFVKNSIEDILENIDYISSKPDEAYSYYREKYKIHLFMDNSNLKGAPIVLETHPTPTRIIGRIERTHEDPSLDFGGIIPGAFHRANGGFLIIPAEEILNIEPSYTFLKWTLKSGKILIENLSEEENIHTAKTLKPEPVPFTGKVILIGSPSTYFQLKENDPDFNELFKIHVEFKTRMENNRKNLYDFFRFIRTFCDKENLKYPDKGALKKIVWFSSRIAESQKKLSTNFGAVCDLLRESNFVASMEKSREIKEKHINIVLERKFRETEIEEIYFEWIKNGVISIDFDGKKIGTINSLTVLTYGEAIFGRPVRITATCSAGKDGVIDIEREAELSGPIHTKGTQILRGYLGYKYGQKFPIYITARIVFEQTYEGVEGDSASAAELLVILSSLSGLPIYQNIAITGSINQFGEIQAVGGINEKIEGVYRALKYKNYRKEFKVLFPETNIENLCLREEVLEFIKKGYLKLIAIRNIDEAIKIIFQKEPSVVHKRVLKKLREFYRILKSEG